MARIPRLLGDRLDYLHEEVMWRRHLVGAEAHGWLDRQAAAVLAAGRLWGFEPEVADRLDELRELLPEET
jgi:hypothetical protein